MNFHYIEEIPCFTNLNSYDFTEKYGNIFAKYLGLNIDLSSNSYHADKSDQYKSIYSENGLSLNDGALIYLLSYEKPYSETVRVTIDIRDWLGRMCSDEKIIKAISLVHDHDKNMNLIKFSEKILECSEHGDYNELIDFRKEFPKLTSENFYSESVYDSSEYNSSGYIFNIKNNGLCNGFSMAINNGSIRITNEDISVFPHKDYNNTLDVEPHVGFGGYIIYPDTKLKYINNLISKKFGIGTAFIEAYVKVYSMFDLSELTDGNYYVITFDKETKKITKTNLMESINTFFYYLDDETLKFELIKKLCKGK